MTGTDVRVAPGAPAGTTTASTASTAATLRRALIWLAALGVAGTALELALIRHWNGFIQMIPWISLGVVGAAIVLLVVRPTPAVIRVVRIVAVLVALSAAYGVYEHVLANYHAGPLDFRYSAKWATMSAASRWWTAISETVGPSPALAPLILAWSSLCLFFATIGHPGKAVTVRS